MGNSLPFTGYFLLCFSASNPRRLLSRCASTSASCSLRAFVVIAVVINLFFDSLFFWDFFFSTLLYTAPPLGTPPARAPFAAIERFRLEIVFEAGNDLSMLLLPLLWLRFSSVLRGSLWELFNCDEYLVKVTNAVRVIPTPTTTATTRAQTRTITGSINHRYIN